MKAVGGTGGLNPQIPTVTLQEGSLRGVALIRGDGHGQTSIVTTPSQT